MTEIIGNGWKEMGEMAEIHLHTAISERTAEIVSAHAAVRRRRRRRRIEEEEEDRSHSGRRSSVGCL